MVVDLAANSVRTDSVKRTLPRMTDALNNPPRASWQQDDFVDTESATPREEDPWDPLHSSASGVRQTDAATAEPSHTVLKAYTDAASEADAEDLVNLLLDDLDGAEPLDDFAHDEVELLHFDEPQPELTAVSVLRDEKYPADDSINNLTLDLKLDHILATLGLDDPELDACRQILKSDSYGVQRLRRFLPWLAEQEWPPGRLLLFLEFRRTWECSHNVHWWEWHYRSYPLFDFHTLSWSATYDLIGHRSHCRPDQVIEESWFLEWEEFEVWRHGIMSFAAFAVLRSSIRTGDCWRDHVFRCDRRSHAELMECSDPTYAPFSLLSVIRQYRLSPIVESGLSGQVDAGPQRSHPEMEWAEWEVELANVDTWIPRTEG